MVCDLFTCTLVCGAVVYCIVVRFSTLVCGAGVYLYVLIQMLHCCEVFHIGVWCWGVVLLWCVWCMLYVYWVILHVHIR